MANRVAIVGVGMARVGRSAAPSWELFAEPARAAIADSGLAAARVQALHIGNAYSAYTERQTNLAPLALSALGMARGIAAIHHDCACASGSVAFRQGYLGVLSGLYDVVLVGGTERLRAMAGAELQQAMTSAMDAGERAQGLTFPVYWSRVARAYAIRHGLDEVALQECLAHVTVKNRYHGAANAHAQFREETTVDAVLASPELCAPIKMMDCAPFSDGAAALVLAYEPVARRCRQPVWIAGSGQASGPFAIAGREDSSASPAIAEAAHQAYQQAGIEPMQVDVAEVHDSANVCEIVCLESAGLFEPGEAIHAAKERRTYVDGELAVNLSGGLGARGHPIGATGAYQLAEMTQILRGDFGGRPHEPWTIGVTVNVGGTDTVATVNVLRRDS